MAASMAELREFRQDVTGWLAENCPEGAKGPGQQANGSTKITSNPTLHYGSSAARKKALLHLLGLPSTVEAALATLKQKFSMKRWGPLVPAHR